MKFLGHVVSDKGVHTDPDKTEAVRIWPVPKTVKEVRSFLGLCSYYRRFVSDFANIARPFINYVRKTLSLLGMRTVKRHSIPLKTL